MRIIYLALVELEIPAGPTVHTLNLMKGFKQIGVDVKLLCPKPSKPVPEIKGFDCVFIPFFGYGPLRLAAFNVLAVFKLAITALTFKPDIIYLRDRPGNIFAAMLARFLNIPYFIEMNGFLESDFHPPNRIYDFFRKAQFKWAKGIIFNCAALRDRYSQAFGITKEKTTIVPMCVDCDIFKILPKNVARSSLSIPEDAFVIGYLGSFSERHDIDILKKLLHPLEERGMKPILLLVGDTNDERRKHEIVEDERVRGKLLITGWVAHAGVPAFLNAMDVATAFALDERGNDPVSFLKMKEYLSCGIPVVANTTNTFESPPPLDDFVELIDFADFKHISPAELADLIVRLAERTSSDKKKECAKFIEHEYGTTAAATQTIDFFIMKSSSAPPSYEGKQ